MNNENLTALKELIQREKSGARELENILKDAQKQDKREKEMALKQAKQIQDSLKKTNEKIPAILGKISIIRKINEMPERRLEFGMNKPKEKPEINKIKQEKKIMPFSPVLSPKNSADFKLTALEKLTVKRFGERKKEEVLEKVREPSKYLGTANRLFAEKSRELLKQEMFKTLEKDLIKANMDIAPVSYVSSMILTAIIAAGIGFFLFLVLLFLNFSNFPFITFLSEPIGLRFLKVFWVIFLVPIVTFIAMYVYPSMEKSSNENKINQELPFATIHMSTISGSMVEPSRIFGIIITTKEYPYLEKEFKKLLNYINVYGYDLVTALKNVASNTASRKLADLFNNLATTINSGGDLPDFFNKRAQSLLFEYRLEREKYIKFSETFMDIYISAVIAAPMILMLLLMMMKISGLGISLSSSMISLIMVLGVAVINIVFLVFLHLRQPSE